jgi:hypothetical protein
MVMPVFAIPGNRLGNISGLSRQIEINPENIRQLDKSIEIQVA